jgi:Chromosome segregation ATPases
MFQEWNERLAELKNKQRHRTNWSKRETELQQELQRAVIVRDRLEEELRKEERDVERLNSLTLGALFYALIGKKREKLTEEEEEALQARIRYEEARDNVSDLEAELAEIKRNLAEVRYVDSDIDAVMREKKRVIESHLPALAAELQSITDMETEAGADRKELQEAVAAGKAVLSALDRAAERLGSAQNWGTYDMLGGGMIATSVKHRRIDEARSSIHTAQNRLRRFQSELKDVQKDVRIQIDIGGMLTFADYFFDGFITDWIVQGKIKESLGQVRDKRSKIRRIVSGLETELRRTESELAELARRRTQLIETAT